MRQSFDLLRSVALLAGLLAIARPAPGECGTWESRFGRNPEIDPNADLYAVTSYDPDGAGPLVPQLIIGGNFFTNGFSGLQNIAAWDGSWWSDVGGGANTDVNAFAVWDPDGDGPVAPRLVAGGQFFTAGGPTSMRIAYWDGVSWHPFGNGLAAGGWVEAITAWDPQGDGLPPQLIAAGSFTSLSNTALNRIGRWDGSGWRALGAGMNAQVWALTVWDSDGAGPQREEIIAGGSFSSAGGLPVNRIARWDGTVWRALGTGVSGDFASIYALASWDPDGSGPQLPRLVAGGKFTTAGGVSANNIAVWDGTSWHPFGSGMNDSVDSLVVWDPDGDGPLGSELVAGGAFTTADGAPITNVARWNGTTWQAFAEPLPGAGVWGLTSWDEDGGGPLGVQLVAIGSIDDWDGYARVDVVRWDGARWLPFGMGLDGAVRSTMNWDPDGEGPIPGRLVVGGDFKAARRVPLNYVSWWDGEAWQPFDAGMDGKVYALCVWYPDAAGPAAPLLIAGGHFSSAGGTAASRVAAWDGVAWQPLGAGLTSGFVDALTTWDPDDEGPLHAVLVAGGSFAAAGGAPARNVAYWDGVSWHPLGLSQIGMSVTALGVWDPDGAGPLGSELVAGGDDEPYVAKWNGATWEGLWDVFSLSYFKILAIAGWDPDGDGPLNPRLFVGGEFWINGGAPANYVAVWDGAIWGPVGDLPFFIRVSAFSTWDPDQDGPETARLVVSGGGAVAHWNGAEWNRFGTTSGGAITLWDPDGDGPLGPTLVNYGTRIWRVLDPEIVITDQPDSLDVCAGDAAVIEVGADGELELSYEWRKGGTPLSDGGRIAGATTNQIRIEPVYQSDAGAYDCRISNLCGEVSSEAVLLGVPLCPHSGDTNCDGLLNFFDIAPFVMAVLDATQYASTYPGCDIRNADVSGDGRVDFFDIDPFVALLFAP